ncbi:MAG: zinc ribbon domain-containing protein, partial [Acidiferrobacterales bacterium]
MRCRHTFEAWRDTEKEEVLLPCPRCGSDSRRVLTIPKTQWLDIGSLDSAFPTANAKWERDREA